MRVEDETSDGSWSVCPRLLLLSCFCMAIDAPVRAPLDDLAAATGPAGLSSVSTVGGIKRPDDLWLITGRSAQVGRTQVKEFKRLTIKVEHASATQDGPAPNCFMASKRSRNQRCV